MATLWLIYAGYILIEIDVKQIVVKPIKSQIANEFVKRWHYSGKTIQNSQLHLGAFYDGILHGVMSFGPSIDKRKTVAIVRGTKFNDYLELNRMAFDSFLPKNSESRSLGVALRLIKKTYPTMEWVISFADGTQCGDGTIYRASGFVLTQINKNKQMMKMPDGSIVARKTLDDYRDDRGRYGSAVAREQGAEYLEGFQLRYIYFLDKTAKDRLTVPILPFSAIDKAGAGMYLGQKKTSASNVNGSISSDQPESGGSSPTFAHNPQGTDNGKP